MCGGKKSEFSASPLPSWGPKRAWNCFVTPKTSGIPKAKRGVKIANGRLTHAFSGAPKGGEIATEALRSRGCPMPTAGTKSEEAAAPMASWGSRRGRNCYVAVAFSGVPNTKHGQKIRSGYPGPSFSGAQKRAEWLCNPGVPGVHNAKLGGEHQNWLPHPCHLGSPKEGPIATETLHYPGLPKAKDG